MSESVFSPSLSKAVLKHRTPDASRNLGGQRVSRSVWSAAVHRRFRKLGSLRLRILLNQLSAEFIQHFTSMKCVRRYSFGNGLVPEISAADIYEFETRSHSFQEGF